MQHMQDKDIDQLFKDRFEDAEIQPSAGLWSNIQKEIKPKQQRKLSVFWLAAACVVVTVSVAVLFNKPEKIQLHGRAAILAKAAPVTRDDAPVKNDATHDQKSGVPSAHTGVLPKKSMTQTAKTRRVLPLHVQAVPKQEKSLLAMQPTSGQSHLIPTRPEIKVSENSLHVTEELPAVQVAVAAVKPNVKTLDEETAAINTEAPEAEQTGRNRIRNAADLVNFVVDKLDKREQKILEFSTDDDDNTSLVAINIGRFKLSTRKHK
jgi:hypothetical protein